VTQKIFIWVCIFHFCT